jgi:cyclic di-GMP phosphodiesterase
MGRRKIMITEQQILNAKIFIIDDEPANVKLLVNFLRKSSYKNLVSITDPRDAVKTYQEVHPDLILLDMNMPHKDGLTLLEEFNQLEIDNYPPVMVLTAQTDKEIRLKALKAGARDFLSKPFDLIEVSLRIKNMLETRLLSNQVRMYSRILEEKFQERSVDLAASQLKLEHEIEERQKMVRKLKMLD